MADNLLVDADDKPFPNLIEHFFPNLDFADVLRTLETIPETDIQGRMQYLADTVPGLPLVADCLASPEELAEKKKLNGELLGRLGDHEPGLNAGIAWQSSAAYDTRSLDSFLAKSPVLTPAMIKAAKHIPLPENGDGFLFELIKTTQATAEVTEWHWCPVALIDGKFYFIEGVWNLFDIPTADKDVLLKYYGDAIRKWQRMPRPAKLFERFHGDQIGPEDMTLGGEYAHDETYAIRSEKVFNWDRQKRGRPFWRVRNVLSFKGLPVETLRHFIAASSLVPTSNLHGSPLSVGVHWALTSCLTLAIDTLFPDDPSLQNRPLQELMLRVGEKADTIYMSHSRNATVEEFLDQYLAGRQSTFAKSDKAAYREQILATMSMKTLRQGHDGQPPFITTYCANHQRPQNQALAKLLEIAGELSLQALRNMVASTA